MLIKLFWTSVFVIGGSFWARFYLRKRFNLSKAALIFAVGGIATFISVVIGLPLFVGFI